MGDGRGGPFGDGLTADDVRSICAVKDNLIVERDRLKDENKMLREALKELTEDARHRSRQTLPPRHGPLVRAEETLEWYEPYMRTFAPQLLEIVRFEGAHWKIMDITDGLARIVGVQDFIGGGNVGADRWVPYGALRARKDW